MGAKGHIARSFRCIEAESRLEPLAFLIDQGYESDGGAYQQRGDPGDPVKCFLGLSVENAKTPQVVQTL
jgi:hypothetical protein